MTMSFVVLVTELRFLEQGLLTQSLTGTQWLACIGLPRLGDVKGARSLLAEARTIIDSISDAGDLPRRLEEAERKLSIRPDLWTIAKA
jgi:hypothetical protein